MNYIEKILLLVLVFISSQSAFAQIVAPDFLCVKNDTLVWETPNNTCGSFNAYIVFASQDIAGPYTELARVTDANQTIFVHAGSTTDVWNYYLQTDANCSGQTMLSSDTLNNRVPEIAPIRAVSIVDNSVEISWEASPSPEVSSYIIYRVTSNGTVPIDRVTNQFSYVDVNANPTEQSEFYYVLAADACENTSQFDDPHSTMVLETSVNPCEQSVDLNWNLYGGWKNGIEKQEVWLSQNGQTAEMLVQLDAFATNFTFTNANDGVEYCFFIKAYENVTGFTSNSNEICQTLDIVQPNRNLFLNFATAVSVNEEWVGLNWQWDVNAEINTLRILRSSDNINYTEISVENVNPPLRPVPTFLDTTVNIAEGPYFYRIQTVDDCDSLATSNYFSTIHVTSTAQGLNEGNLISFTPLEVENGAVVEYEIVRFVEGELITVAVVDNADSPVIDVLEPDGSADEICYYVVGTVAVTKPDGSQETITSRSNIACLEEAAQIFVPNAFAPTGQNTEFRPVVAGNDRFTDYQMNIFDRYGQLIFENSDINTGWKGRSKNGDILQQGVFVYYVKLVQNSGRVVEKRGTVLLLR